MLPPAFSLPAATPGLGRRAVVVLGMHRGGTSAVTGCLRRLGVDFGPRLMPATPANPRGFYEHIDIVNLHDRLLLAAGSSWSDTGLRPPDWLTRADADARFTEDLRTILRRDFGAAPLWGVKDPRLCHLLPWWQLRWTELDTKPLFVFVLRNPSEVAASLAHRDGFSFAKGYLLWLQHVLAGERATRGSERVLVDFSEFLLDWQKALAPVSALLGKDGPVSTALDLADEDNLVDPTMARTSSQSAVPPPPRWVREVDNVLRRERKSGPELFEKMDLCRADLEMAAALFSHDGEHENDRAVEFAALQQRARWYEAEWQKARGRWEKVRAQLEAGRGGEA